MTTFQPAMVGFSSSVPRGLSPLPLALGDVVADALGDVDASLPALSSFLSPPRTRKPVTPAATTTAVAAVMAMTLVLFPPPPGGWGAPAGAGVPHWGCPGWGP